jgi:MarR family 2-MHQ and catechol resistance regulon transcriptional repressor
VTIQVREEADAEFQARGIAEWVSLYQTYNAIFKVTELALLPHNLSLPQFHLLSVLKRGGGILTTGEIGREMVKASQTITGLVDRLEAQGFVERRFDRRDRRKTWVQLTAKGERKWEEAMPVANRLAERMYSVLTDRELAQLGAKTEKLRAIAMEDLAKALTGPLPGITETRA